MSRLAFEYARNSSEAALKKNPNSCNCCCFAGNSRLKHQRTFLRANSRSRRPISKSPLPNKRKKKLVLYKAERSSKLNKPRVPLLRLVLRVAWSRECRTPNECFRFNYPACRPKKMTNQAKPVCPGIVCCLLCPKL